MARQNISIGIDLGSAHTRVVALAWTSGEPAPEIIYSGTVPSKGLRHGYIVNPSDTANSIRKAVSLAEKEIGKKITSAVFSLGGVSLASETTSGLSIITKADGEITKFDIKSALANAKENIELKNRSIIYNTALAWKLDGKEIQGKPEGMRGVKLEVRLLSVTCLTQHLNSLLDAAAEAGIEVDDVVPTPLAASMVGLSERQKAVGVMLVNIGAETVSLAVFEAGLLVGLSVFPIGSADITNDIALGFRIPLEEAESIKTGSVLNSTYPKRKVDEIIEARFSDIFELIDNYLKKIKRSGLLPAGVIITGGGSAHALVEGLSKEMLRLPSKVGTENTFPNIKGTGRDSTWYVSYGLGLWGFLNIKKDSPKGNKGGIKNLFKEFLKQFLP